MNTCIACPYRPETVVSNIYGVYCTISVTCVKLKAIQATHTQTHPLARPRGPGGAHTRHPSPDTAMYRAAGRGSDAAITHARVAVCALAVPRDVRTTVYARRVGRCVRRVAGCPRHIPISLLIYEGATSDK